ncbi:MAG: hypothetical protein U0Q22_19000 [Acidimicrobiales bacterium]
MIDLASLPKFATLSLSAVCPLDVQSGVSAGLLDSLFSSVARDPAVAATLGASATSTSTVVLRRRDASPSGVSVPGLVDPHTATIGPFDDLETCSIVVLSAVHDDDGTETAERSLAVTARQLVAAETAVNWRVDLWLRRFWPVREKVLDLLVGQLRNLVTTIPDLSGVVESGNGTAHCYQWARRGADPLDWAPSQHAAGLAWGMGVSSSQAESGRLRAELEKVGATTESVDSGGAFVSRLGGDPFDENDSAFAAALRDIPRDLFPPIPLEDPLPY